MYEGVENVDIRRHQDHVCFYFQDHQDLIPGTVKMLKNVVMKYPDLSESAWLSSDCSMILCISLRYLSEWGVKSI